ncbi:hypothetical protein CY34DRAFT_106166 [Suillus luteus UH-Slu-Lm8-n1]|uniref:Uncharacterized protein n=1 Tax=Suillus luteus UH-Slu-Lm8-n1 TaxID=930992 RepID=A0A0D0BL91_9AGAM|nr:hypothetical protein CY34DRAFT_106166 [Suillus luteus UH-Slu-Lm8-n1]
MNDLDLSLPSRAYPSPSSSTYRRAGIFLAVHPLRNLARFIRLDLSRPCGIDSSSVARGGNTAPILPNQSSFGISPILKVARLDPSRAVGASRLCPECGAAPPKFGDSQKGLPSLQCDNRPLSTNQGSYFRLHESFKDQRLNLKQGSSEQSRSISKIHGHGYLPFPQTLTNWAYWSAFAEFMYVPREANVGRGFVLSVLVHGVHLMIKISSRQESIIAAGTAPHPTAG